MVRGATSVDERLRSATSTAAHLETLPGRLLVVAPHPDDETLTVGGLILRTLARGGRVEVVAVTDGGSAYPDVAHDDLAAIRRDEQNAAVATLGSPIPVHRLGIVDGDVAGHEREIVEALCDMADPGTTIVAPWQHDVHPDHEAVGRSAAASARRVGCESWSSLFWAWHSVEIDPRRHELIRLDLSPVEIERKAQALACHRSQLTRSADRPILTDEELTPASWPSEIFVLSAGA